MFRNLATWALTHSRKTLTIGLLLVLLLVSGDPAAAYDSGGGSLVGIGP